MQPQLLTFPFHYSHTQKTNSGETSLRLWLCLNCHYYFLLNYCTVPLGSSSLSISCAYWVNCLTVAAASQCQIYTSSSKAGSCQSTTSSLPDNRPTAAAPASFRVHAQHRIRTQLLHLPVSTHSSSNKQSHFSGNYCRVDSCASLAAVPPLVLPSTDQPRSRVRSLAVAAPARSLVDDIVQQRITSKSSPVLFP